MINGVHPQMLEWKEYGFRLQLPAGATSKPCDITVTVKAIVFGQFQIPEGHELVSALYAISATRKFEKPVSVEIEHCVRLENEQDSQLVRWQCTKVAHLVHSSCTSDSQARLHMEYGQLFVHSCTLEVCKSVQICYLSG